MTVRLEVGQRYVSDGQQPQEVEIVEIDETAQLYRTAGARQVAEVILFGCEHMWRPVEPARVAWHDGRMVAFDLETTSPEPQDARIVTAAVAVVGGGLATETLTLLADPGVEIPEEAAAIHGITTEKARGEGRPVYDVLVAVLERLTVHLRAGLPLVIFNARYDLTVLDREARRNGVVPLTERGFDLRVVDPLVLDKWLHRYRKGSRKLDAQAEHYKARLDQAHDAAADAVAAARVAWCIGKRGQVIRRVRNGGDAIELKRLQAEWEQVRDDLDRLHAAQQVWARAERARFAEYKRSIGEPEVAVRVEAEDWPLTPFVAPEHGRLVDVEPVVPRPGNAIAA